MKKWIDSVLSSSKTPALPFITHPGIEINGEKVIKAVSDGYTHYEAIKTVSETFATSVATVIMDLTTEAEAFGAEISMSENEVPSIVGRLLNNDEDIEILEVPDLSKGRVPAYLLANKLAVENLEGKPVFSGCIGPFSLAGRLYDMSEIMISIYTEPDAMLMLLGKCTEFLKEYCREFKRIGTAGVVIAEPAAGLLSNDDCLMYSTHFVKQIVDELQDDNFTIILHNCGNTGHCTEAMLESGANALHFGNAIDMKSVLLECPPDKIIMGNLDPVGVFKLSKPEEIKLKTIHLLNEAKDYPNFVISSGCDIPPYTPIENIRAFYDAVNEFNSQH